MNGSTERATSFGQTAPPSMVDRFGIWLSARSIARRVGDLSNKRVADIGCGFDATLGRRLADVASQVTLFDLALADDLAHDPRFTVLVGPVEVELAAIPDDSFDVVFCVSVLEHLRDDRGALLAFHRVLARDGVLYLNVPSWRGKWALEFSAFKLGLSPAVEMDDHKRYYDPRDLWPLLVEAGFAPHAIECRRHKFGLNTYAVCRVADRIVAPATEER